MTLCDDCLAAEADRFGIAQTWRDRPCCLAREVACHPRPRMAGAFKAATAGMDEALAAWVRDRAHELIRTAKARR